MRRFTYLALPLAAAMALGHNALAAPAKVPSAAEVAAGLPQTGRKTADFVPVGWEIQSSARGDLNHDTIPDMVLALTEHRGEDAPKKFDENYKEPSHVVVVLFAQKDGGLRRAAVNTRLWAPGQDTPEFSVSISKGILLVKEVLGVGEHADVTFRFRHAAASGKLMLIGFDYELWHAQQPDQLRRSENYLTGVALEASGKSNQWGRTRRKTIKKVQVPFEKARMNADNGVMAVRPY